MERAYDITWSPGALSSYEAILNYIGEKFSKTDVQKFIGKTLVMLEHVSRNPTMFRKSEKGRNKHIVVITKQTTLYYRYKPKKKEVELLLFWDTRRNPSKLKY